MKLTVMSMNVRVDVASDGVHAWPNRVVSVADVFLTHHPIVAGIQEGLLYMLNDIMPLLPNYKFIGEGREGGENGEYCAIFYDSQVLKVKESGQFWLSETPHQPSKGWESACPRICTWGQFASVSHPDAQFEVYNTHLDHMSQEAREQGAKLIWQFICRRQGSRQIPVILMGDMNAEPNNRAIQFLRGTETIAGESAFLSDVWATTPELTGATYHGFTGDVSGNPIDYIFVSKNITVNQVTIDREKHADRFPSDHFPIIAALEWMLL